MKIFIKILIVTILITFTACFSKQKEKIFFTVETIIEEQPDSVLTLLKTLKTRNLSKYEQAKVVMFEVIAKNKLGQDISHYKEIFNAVEIILKKGDNTEKAKVLLYASKVSYESEEYEKGATYAVNAKSYEFSVENDNLKGLILGNYAWIYYNETNADSAILYYKKALCYFNKTSNYYNITITSQMIGNCFLILENKDSALYYYKDALKISEEHDNIQQTRILSNIGALYNYFDEFENSITVLKKALLKSSKQEDSLLIYLNIANTYLNFNDLDSATYYINRCFDFLNNKESKYATETLIAAYGVFSDIEEGKGNLKNALKIQKIYNSMVDSIYSEMSKQKLIEIQEKYKHEKLEKENEKLRADKKIISWRLISVIILLGFIILGINRKRIRREKEILQVLNDYETLKKMAKQIKEKDNNRQETECKDISFQSPDDKTKQIQNQSMVSMLLFDYFKVVAKVEKLEKKIFDSKLSKEEIIKDSGKITYETLKKITPQLIDIMDNINPKLSETEIIICILYYAGFENQDIVTYTGLNINVIHTRSSNIRKKLGIELKGSIAKYLEKRFATFL